MNTASLAQFVLSKFEQILNFSALFALTFGRFKSSALMPVFVKESNLISS
jgi:hypothetical protein